MAKKERSESKTTVIAALFANLVIAVAKYFVAIITGSAAMTSEAIHSTVDTGNELLLLFGRKRARTPADQQHPFGYGLELYFWTLIVAVVLFGIGGGMSIVEGISHLIHPPELEPAQWTYAVLGLAAISEGISWTISIRTIHKTLPNRSLWQAVKDAKDPQKISVFLEDSAALIGIALAAIGVTLSHLLSSPLYDGLAAILIGLTLGAVALLLARETRSLLIGEAASKDTLEKIQREVKSDPAVLDLRRPLTMHFGPDQVLMNLDVQFRELSSDELARAVDRLEQKIRGVDPRIQRIFIEARSFRADSQHAT